MNTTTEQDEFKRLLFQLPELPRCCECGRPFVAIRSQVACIFCELAKEERFTIKLTEAGRLLDEPLDERD